MEGVMTEILVTKPKTLSASDKKLLRDSGVVVVECANPEDVRFLRPAAEVPHGDILYAALQAIQRGLGSSAKEEFVRILANLTRPSTEGSAALRLHLQRAMNQ